MTGYILSGLNSLLQCVVFIAFLPLLTWCLQDAPLWLMGERLPPVPWRGYWQGWRMVWRRRLSVVQALALAAGGVALLSLPVVSTNNALSGLADPLLLGSFLVVGRLALGRWVVWSGASPMSASMLRQEWRGAGLALVILSVIEALIALAAPGSDGLSGLCMNLRVEPVPGLEGALACAAVALVVVCPPLRPITPGRGLMAQASAVRFEADMARHVARVLDGAWLLLVVDIGLPGLIGQPDGTLWLWCEAFGGVALRLAVGLGVIGVLRVMQQERAGRIAVLCVGMALLLALSGRAAT